MNKSTQIQDIIERCLTYFSLCEMGEMPVLAQDYDAPKEQLAWIGLPLSYFNGADLSLAYPDEMVGTARYERGYFTDVQAGDLQGVEWDVKLFLMPRGAPSPGCVYGAIRTRRVPLSEVRGMFQVRTGVVVEYSQVELMKDGTYKPGRHYCEKLNGKWTVVGQPVRVWDDPLDDYQHGNVEMSKSVAFTRYYDWSVEIGWSGMPTIAIPTDPIGAREIFRLRDLPPGKSRRAALHNWVSGHFRQVRQDPVEELKILPYLRGSLNFDWNGMQCRIHPSQYDLARNKDYAELGERLKRERAAAMPAKKRKRR